MLTPDELYNALIGQEIEGVDVCTNYEDDIYSVEIRLKDGTIVNLSPTSFNYGGQHLNIEIT